MVHQGQVLSIVAVFVLFASVSAGQEPAKDEPSWTVFYENDNIYPPKNEDRNYTMGLGAERLTQGPPTIPILKTPARFAQKLFPEWTGDEHYAGFFVGVSAFTPNDLEDSEPILDDRPYGSLLVFTQRVIDVKEDEGRVRTAEFSFGILGLYIARETQSWIHEHITPSRPDPKGWENQISAGGEPTAMMRWTESQLLFVNKPTAQDGKVQLSVGYDIALGYETYVAVGGALRVGRIRSPFWAFNSSPFRSHTNLSAQSRSDGRPIQDWFFFASAQSTLVGYNALLQGQFADSEVTFASDEIERFLGGFQVGVAIGGENWNLAYSISGRSAEFKGPNARPHYWGGLKLAVRF